jgi:hypothetical protein
MNDLLDQTESHPSTARTVTSGAASWPNNPLRPPDWRWQRAGQPPMKRVRRGCQDDDWVARCRRFQAVLEQAGCEVRHPRLVRAHPEILGAVLLRQGERRRRYEAEARLLAGQSNQEIADHLGVDAEVIGAYEALFYSVRDRLTCSDWVAACVLGPGLWEGFDVGDVERLWKVIAYQYGPLIFDALIENVREDGRPPADPELAEQLELLVTLTAMPAIPKNATAVLRLDALVREVDRAEADRSVATLTRRIIVPRIEVQFGPQTIPLMHAECSPNDPDGTELAVKGGPSELSDAS